MQQNSLNKLHLNKYFLELGMPPTPSQERRVITTQTTTKRHYNCPKQKGKPHPDETSRQLV
jgi:hypothetical protein